MATEHKVKMRVTLEPVGEPWVAVDADGWGRVQQLTETTDFDLEFNTAADICNLKIEHFNKDDNDPTTAVIVREISFFGISDPKFVWAGVYYPDYPEHYADKTSPLRQQNYLGWNGVYRLDFTVPVFTWMHQTLSMGWIYG
jgi:hypothetical protein